MLAFVAVGSGVSVLIGFLTPVGSVVAALVSAGTALSWLPELPSDLLQRRPDAAFVAVIALALAFLGPGGCSIDARLFGRREIVIPQVPRSPKS